MPQLPVAASVQLGRLHAAHVLQRVGLQLVCSLLPSGLVGISVPHQLLVPVHLCPSAMLLVYLVHYVFCSACSDTYAERMTMR